MLLYQPGPQWYTPIGIPKPTWGIDQVAPATPDPWNAEVPGFYYIDKSAPSGSSDSNVYGRPGKARYTIPKSLPAGSVVVVHGTYNYSHASPNQITANGTESNPVFITGLDSTVMRQMQIKGSYFILEDLKFALTNSSDSKPPCIKFISPATFGVIRNSELGGNLAGGGIQLVSGHDHLVFNNFIHDSGDINSPTDQDIHSINIGGCYNVWIVGNEITRSSGAGTQVNAGSLAAQPNTHHIYLGGNWVHETRQAGLAVKQAMDVIISSNKIHNIINREPNASDGGSPSKGIGYQYAPERVWIIYNEIHDCYFGVYSGSDSGMGSGRYSYIIGNVIHNIHHLTGSYNPNSAWSFAGIMLAGGLEKYVINNTLDTVDSGIYNPNTAGKITILNNIVNNVTEPGATHIFVEHGGVAEASEINNNLYDPSAKIKWGNNTALPLNQFQATYAPKGEHCISGNPQYSEGYKLAQGSVGINEGVLSDVYETFKATYGLDIQVDKDGNPRPVEQWDIGAYEYQGNITPPDPCSEIKAENEALKAQVEDLTTENANLTRKINDAIKVLSE